MGYGSIYAQRMNSRLTKNEVKYLDRLFLKAYANTQVGKKELGIIETAREADRLGIIVMGVITLQGNEIDLREGAETLYQQTGLYIFGDNEFAFRQFHDTKESAMDLSKLVALPLLPTTPKILDTLPTAIEKALVEIEKRCTPPTSKPEARYESNSYKKGAWDLYDNLVNLVPNLIPYPVSKYTIRKRFKKYASFMKY